MNENDRPPVEDIKRGQEKMSDQENEDDYCSNLSKYLKEYDMKLLRSMKGFGKTMILWLISKDKIHGYELMNKMNELSPSKKAVSSPSQIYPILHDLEEAGLIEGTWDAQGKRKIKYYEITNEGIQTLHRIRTVFRCHRTQILEEFWRDMFSKNEE
ncbi:MAG: PadR family transcriptional regulator [Methanobacterium sp.]